MVQCPNSKACMGNREALRACKQQAYMAEDDPTQVQLIELTRLSCIQSSYGT